MSTWVSVLWNRLGRISRVCLWLLVQKQTLWTDRFLILRSFFTTPPFPVSSFSIQKSLFVLYTLCVYLALRVLINSPIGRLALNADVVHLFSVEWHHTSSRDVTSYEFMEICIRIDKNNTFFRCRLSRLDIGIHQPVADHFPLETSTPFCREKNYHFHVCNNPKTQSIDTCIKLRGVVWYVPFGYLQFISVTSWRVWPQTAALVYV